VLVEQTHHFTAAFVVAAVVSVLGLVGWVWMVPQLAPLTWKERRAAPGAAPSPQTQS
jgi:hypothetical protein